MTNSSTQPLVYSCSGCSSAAQMANFLAVQLDRRKDAEMSCIAGVGGHVKKLVKTALSGRPILAIDGCPLACVKASLAQHHVSPAFHVDLSQFGIQKKMHADFDPKEAIELLQMLREIVAQISNDNTPVKEETVLECTL